jgi:hypothetical protein
MMPTFGYVSLRLLDTGDAIGAEGADLRFDASVEVDTLSGHGTFAATVEVISRFTQHLDDLAERLTPSARLECGLVAEDERISYFSCQIERIYTPVEFAAQVSLGTAGPQGVMHRLHVGLQLEPKSVATFRRELQDILIRGSGIATLGARPE